MKMEGFGPLFWGIKANAIERVEYFEEFMACCKAVL